MLAMNCTQAEGWIGALADREAQGWHARRLWTHVNACPRCSRRYRAILAWKRQVACLRTMAAPGRLRARLEQHLKWGPLPAPAPVVLAPRPLPVRLLSSGRRALLWEGLAAAALVAAVAIGATRGTGRPTDAVAATHAQAYGALPGLASNQLEPRTAQSVWLHLAGCPRCFASYRTLWLRANSGAARGLAPDGTGPHLGPPCSGVPVR